MLIKRSSHISIARRASRIALAVVLAVSLCPGSRELFSNVAFADPESQIEDVFGGVSDMGQDGAGGDAGTGGIDANRDADAPGGFSGADVQADALDSGETVTADTQPGAVSNAKDTPRKAPLAAGSLLGAGSEPWTPGEMVGQYGTPTGVLAKDAGATIIDNSKYGITMNLFDYYAVDAAEWGRNENNFGHVQNSGINAGRNNNNSGQVGADNMTHLQFYANGTQGFGINNFAGYDNNYWDGYQTINDNNKYSQQYAMQGIVQSSLGSDGFPVLNTTNGGSLSYLFNTTPSSNAKDVYENVNGLFYLTNEGRQDEMMTYNSNQTYAYYNAGTNSFDIYNDTYSRYSGTGGNYAIGFFPFDEYNGGPYGTGASKPGVSINPTQSRWNSSNHVNHHLGLTMSATIDMPYDGKIYDKETGESEDMIFKFSGDDDMWVFVDGKLVLDVGGIHQPVEGTINFHTGKISISSGTAAEVQQNSYTMTARTSNSSDGQTVSTTAEDEKVRGDVSYLWGTDGEGHDVSKNGLTGNAASIFGDQWRAGTAHTIQFFYMERGGCDSNLEISTNMHKLMPRTAQAKKQWDSSVKDQDKVPVQVQLIRKAVARDGGELVGYAEVGEPVTLQDGAWSTSWSDLPSEGYNPTAIYYTDKGDYNSDSNPGGNRYCDYTYLVREIPAEGYIASYSYVDSSSNEVTAITPEAVSEMTSMAFEVASSNQTDASVSVARTAKDHDSQEAYPGGSASFGPYALNSGNYYEYGIDDQSAFLTYESAGETKQLDYTYTINPAVANTTVTQARYGLSSPDGDSVADAGAVPADFAEVTVTNTPIYLEVEKQWLDAQGQLDNGSHGADTVYVQLQKQTYDEKTSTWGDWANEGDPVALDATVNASAGKEAWKTKFLVSNSENVRYRVLEGTVSGGTFTAARQFDTTGNSTSSTADDGRFVHDSTSYTRNGTWYAKDGASYTATQNGTTRGLEYFWTKLPTGQAQKMNYLRTFDGDSELMAHTGDPDETFTTDAIDVVLTIPAKAASIPDGAGADCDYVATVALGSGLDPGMTEPEEGSGASPTWDVESSGVGATVTKDADAYKVTVTVPAATAKANAGNTVTVSIPVSGSDLSAIAESSPSVVTVQETRYDSSAKDGTATSYTEGTGGDYVVLGSDSTGGKATIANKPLLTKLTVQKKWADADNNDHAADSVWVRITKDGSPASSLSPNPVELKKDMGADGTAWTYTFEGLELGGTYTVEEGAYEGGTFTPQTEFTFSVGGEDKTYVQQSLKYYSADGAERTKTETVEEDGKQVEKTTAIGNLDGWVAPDAGKAVIANGVPGAQVNLVKVDAETEVDDATGMKTPLEGAKFKIYKDAMAQGETEVAYAADVDAIDANLVTLTIGEGADERTISEFETAADGSITFPYLEAGAYWLLETGVPAGYALRDAAHPVGIVVDAHGVPALKGVGADGKAIDASAATYDTDKSRPALKVVKDGKIVMWDHDEDPSTDLVEKTEPTEDGEAYAIVFPNMQLYVLPATGGPGVLPLLFVGAFLVTLAVAAKLSPRRLVVFSRASGPRRAALSKTSPNEAVPGKGRHVPGPRSERARGGGRWL